MKQRLKQLRTKLKLSQDKFGEKLKIKRSHVSSLENGTRNITDRLISDICREFNVREIWFREGKGEIFIKKEKLSLDEYADMKGLSDLEKEIFRDLMELDSNTRQAVIAGFKALIEKQNELMVDEKDEPSSVEFSSELTPENQEMVNATVKQLLVMQQIGEPEKNKVLSFKNAPKEIGS